MFCLLTAKVLAESELPAPEAGAPAATGKSGTLDFEISKGKLLLENLAGAPIKHTRNVEATLQNVTEVLRDIYPNFNITLAPGLENLRIGDLKLRLSSMQLNDVLQALELASSAKFSVRGSKTSFLLAPTRQQSSRKTEVFNLSGYLQSLEDRDDKSVASAVNQVRELILETYRELKPSETASPSFQFHPGANLLIMIGEPEALEVGSKVVNALQPPPAILGGMGGGVYLPKPAGTSKLRRAIMNKLESIQMNSVQFDNLPLGEVVRFLVSESKALDPEKRGVNFLINPNQPAPGPGANAVVRVDPTTGLPVESQKPEPVDLDATTIRILPALEKVRLIDVLDAIVKVADHPLKYSVTDYAVVFSLRSPEEPADAFGGFPGAAGR
jgi:hypothetical protein